MVDKVAIQQVFLPELRFARQYHSINAPTSCFLFSFQWLDSPLGA
jgi:hypothetical protein